MAHLIGFYDGSLKIKGKIATDSQRMQITSVTFPEGLQSIGHDAFFGCPLTSVTFPEGLKSIGEGAFSGCPLTSGAVPDLKTSIHQDAFSGCPALEGRRLASGHKSVCRTSAASSLPYAVASQSSCACSACATIYTAAIT